MVKQEAKDAAFGARLFYNGIMIFTIGIFLYYDNDLQRSIITLKFPYFLSFFALVGTCYYLFYDCGKNPGFVELLPKKEVQQVELSIPHSGHLEGKESLLQPQTETSSEHIIDIEAGKSVTLSHQEDQNTTKNIKISKKKKNEGSDWMPELRYCDKCEVTQPYRAKHCDQCERCVHKFDHHCFWIGGCVGELNHRKFWLFLLFQSVLEVWAYFIADSGLDASYTKGMENIKNKEDKSPYTTSEYGAFTILVVVLILATLFTSILGGFHTFLLLTNQTTWEYAKKDRISYLKIYPKSFYPFSKGIRGNIQIIFFHGNKIRNWELPPIDNSRQKRGFNWCENEYWVCC